MYLFYKNTNKKFNGNGWMCVINHYEDFDEYFNQQYLIENGRGLKSKAANCCMFFVWVLFLKVIYCIFLHRKYHDKQHDTLDVLPECYMYHYIVLLFPVIIAVS